jgi:glutathione peroxidase
MLKISLLFSILLIFGPPKTDDGFYSYSLSDIDGKPLALSQYKGKVVLLVNVASKCGYTKQYSALQELHTKYADKGLVILGVPANNFGGQEPGTNEEIKEFCSTKFNVSFPMASKVSVKGDDMHALIKYLTNAENPDFKGDIRWNFEKFLISKDGKLVRRFRSGAGPMEKDIIAAVEAALK